MVNKTKRKSRAAKSRGAARGNRRAGGGNNSVRLEGGVRVINSRVPATPRSVRFVLKFSKFLNSSAGGIIVDNIASDSSGSLTDWASCAALFDCYKIKRMWFEYVPFNTFDGLLSYPPLFVIYDGNTIAAVSATLVDPYLQYDNVRIMDLTKHWTYMVTEVSKPSATNATILEGGFVATAATANWCSIQWIAVNCSVSTKYGSCIAYFDIEFASRN